jgi:hypothetical protein
MKKSNIILISAILLAVCWSLLLGYLSATSINDFLQGKDPRFARTRQQLTESSSKRFPVPAGELFVSGEDAAVLNIRSGKELTVLYDPRAWSCEYTGLTKGKAMISIKSLKGNFKMEPVTIMIPEITSLSLDNFSAVFIDGWTRKKIHVQGTRVNHLTIVNCRAGALELDFPGTQDFQDVLISKLNLIDTLEASVKGAGRLRLETAGLVSNHFSLSDSVIVEANSDLLKKLPLKP